MADPLYRLARVGLTPPWGVWRLGRGGFDDDCDRCGGTGVVDVLGRHPHYDVRPRAHARAIRQGAIVVTTRELIGVMRGSRATA